jgi:hypothetical protein
MDRPASATTGRKKVDRFFYNAVKMDSVLPAAVAAVSGQPVSKVSKEGVDVKRDMLNWCWC